MSNFQFSHNSIRKLDGVDGILKDLAEAALAISVIDFGIASGMRTAGEQNGLYMNQKSKCDGYRKISRHQEGKAIDFYPYVDGGASYTREHCALVAAAFLQAAGIMGVRVEWGGLFSDWFDGPHIQLAR